MASREKFLLVIFPSKSSWIVGLFGSLAVKREKKELDRLETAEISRLEQQVLNGEKTEPVTTAEFDRYLYTIRNLNTKGVYVLYICFISCLLLLVSY